MLLPQLDLLAPPPFPLGISPFFHLVTNELQINLPHVLPRQPRFWLYFALLLRSEHAAGGMRDAIRIVLQK